MNQKPCRIAFQPVQAHVEDEFHQRALLRLRATRPPREGHVDLLDAFGQIGIQQRIDEGIGQREIDPMPDANRRMPFDQRTGPNGLARGVVIHCRADPFGLPQIGDELLAIHRQATRVNVALEPTYTEVVSLCAAFWAACTASVPPAFTVIRPKIRTAITAAVWA